MDDPVVACDAIKRDLALGHPPVIAAWLGRNKLARASVLATINQPRRVYAVPDVERRYLGQFVPAEHFGKSGASPLVSLTTFIGGSPRLWWFATALLKESSTTVPGARIDMRQLESGKAVGLPVGIRPALDLRSPRMIRSVSSKFGSFPP